MGRPSIKDPRGLNVEIQVTGRVRKRESLAGQTITATWRDGAIVDTPVDVAALIHVGSVLEPGPPGSNVGTPGNISDPFVFLGGCEVALEADFEVTGAEDLEPEPLPPGAAP